MAGLTDHAYATIRELILNDQYGQGQRLPEEDLAAVTQASRTPVREALRRLAAEGLVDFSPNRGARVASWSEHDLEEIYGLRALLEGYGAGLAATHAATDDVTALRELADEMEALAARAEPADLDEVATLNEQFHRVILGAAGNKRLVTVLQAVVPSPLIAKAFRRYDAASLERSMRQHRELIAAIDSHDSVWASAIMQAHILAARNDLSTVARAAAARGNGGTAG